METVVQDLRFAVRGFMKAPGFMLLAVLSLGLGVGANTSMFSMIDRALWTDLPVPQADELVLVREIRGSATEVSYPNYLEIVAEADIFDGAFRRSGATFGLVSDEVSQVIYGELVTASYFDVLGIAPERGRFFDSVEHSAPNMKFAMQ